MENEAFRAENQMSRKVYSVIFLQKLYYREKKLLSSELVLHHIDVAH